MLKVVGVDKQVGYRVSQATDLHQQRKLALRTFVED